MKHIQKRKNKFSAYKIYIEKRKTKKCEREREEKKTQY